MWQHRLVILIESNDVSKRGHHRFQFRKTISVRARYPQPCRSGSSGLERRVGQEQFIVASVYMGVIAERSVRYALSAGRPGYIGDDILLETKGMRP